MEEAMKITTTHINPPIPDRSFDWLATLEDHDGDGPQGFGATESDAVSELTQQIEENAEPTTSNE